MGGLRLRDGGMQVRCVHCLRGGDVDTRKTGSSSVADFMTRVQVRRMGVTQRRELMGPLT
eukprot:1553542-Pyramimonas_sp.AAC.2